LFVSTALPALAAPPAPQPQPQAQGLPQPKIVVINRSAILQISKVGQDIGRQVQALSNQAKADINAQAKSLEAQGQALQQQIAILSPDAKAAKVKDFEAKQAALQAQIQKKESLIQGGLMQAQNAVGQALQPILAQLMQQRGANMILDKNAVMMANDNRFDITQPAIDMLNQKMPTYKVQLAPLPPGMAPQQ
jgi:Skp family chaperone for outer membrane proteins